MCPFIGKLTDRLRRNPCNILDNLWCVVFYNLPPLVKPISSLIDEIRVMPVVLHNLVADPQINGISVSGRNLTYISASAADFVNLGSATMNFAPLAFASRMCCIETGCDTATFSPQKKIGFECHISFHEFVIAPKLQVFVIPATVVE